MNEDQGYIRAVSLHLSRTLDEIGLNTMTVKRRRDLYIYSEQNFRIFDCMRGIEVSTYHFGSQIEGATIPGLGSDVDFLILHNGVNVIQDRADFERGKDNLLMLQQDTAPGYCRLQLLRSDFPTIRNDLLSEIYTYDSSDRIIMKNTWPHKLLVPGMSNVRNGPARSRCDRPGITDHDFVLAFGCISWPEQANSFTRRQRRYDWPTQRLIQEAIKHGVFLVPVGYKLSSTENLEWRISASLAERCLMFSLSIVHIKCYVVLKMLMKTCVEPRVGKCITSYHCKTAVLYCTENTEPGFWRDDNLLQCVTQCLVKLLAWVTDGFCPQFIIAEENLFAGKITAKNRSALKYIFTELIKSCGRKILNVQIDDLGVKLQRKINTCPSIIPVLDSMVTVTLLEQLDFESHTSSCIASNIKTLLKNAISSIVVCFVNKTIGVLKDHMRLSNKHELRAVQTSIEFLYRWLGSLLASISLSQKTRLPRHAIQLLHFGRRSDVTSMLKLASVFYCNGDARKTGIILHRLEHYYSGNEIQPVCACFPKGSFHSLAFCSELFTLKGRKKRSARFAQCVTFSPQEIHCAPPALQNELFRSVGDDMQQRHPMNDRWMDLAAVDCRPYLYYLQYMTYRQLGQRNRQTRALNNLDRCIREDVIVNHLETSWSLLGQCLELEQQPEAAMGCYRTSLEIRPKNNAANWHVAILCYRLIQDGYVPRVCYM